MNSYHQALPELLRAIVLLGRSENSATNAEAQRTLQKAYEVLGRSVHNLPPLVSKSVSTTHQINRAYHARESAQQALTLLEHILAGTDEPKYLKRVGSLICEAYETL